MLDPHPSIEEAHGCPKSVGDKKLMPPRGGSSSDRPRTVENPWTGTSLHSIMIPNALYSEHSRVKAEGPESRELRSYMRSEWNAGLGWLFASVPRKRRDRSGTRLLVRIRRALSRVGLVFAKSVEGSAIAKNGRDEIVETLESPVSNPPRDGFPAHITPESAQHESCEHVDQEYLGSGGSAFYGRCRNCEAVIIRQGGGAWTVRSKPL